MKHVNPHAPLKDVYGVVVLDQERLDEERRPEDPMQWWVDTARQAYDASLQFWEVTQAQQIRRNLDNFASRHPEDSRYHTPDYQYRSRTFKPKTRIASRQLEEDAAEIFFGTNDLADVRPCNKDSKDDAFAARLHKYLLDWRLKHDLPHFEMVMGGVQDAFKQGDVVSGVGWESKERQEERTRDATTFDGETGDMLWQADDVYSEPTMEYNRPTWRLIPLEHLHIDAGVVWYDPINTSPFIIEDMPMHIQRVKARMAKPGVEPVGNQWRYLPDPMLLSAATTADNQESIRAKRQGDSIDPLSSNAYRTVNDHQIIMVRRVILQVEEDGELTDWLYYTAGGQYLLSEPVPLRDRVPWLKPGERDYQWGYAGIETHRTYKAAPAEWLQDLQAAANVEHNSRSDNIALALNKRYKIKRGSVIDLSALRSSVPGGIYEVDKMDDVEHEQWADVGGASFFNEDRMTNDFDALAGSFGQGTVANQRNLNETVGGMRMMQQGAGKARSYMIMTVAATWWMKVLDHLLRMIKEFSTEDEIIEAVDRMLADGEEFPEIPPLELMQIPTEVTVNMRLGSDPMTRMNNLMGVVANFRETPVLQQIDWPEIFKEAAGAAGFGDGDRFLLDMEGQDPIVVQLQQQIQELQQIIETKQIEQQGRTQVAQITADASLQREQMKSETALRIQEMKNQIAAVDEQIKAAKTDHERQELELAREGLIHQINVAKFNMQKELTDLSEQHSESPAPGNAGKMARDDYGLIAGRTG